MRFECIRRELVILSRAIKPQSLGLDAGSVMATRGGHECTIQHSCTIIATYVSKDSCVTRSKFRLVNQ